MEVLATKILKLESQMELMDLRLSQLEQTMTEFLDLGMAVNRQTAEDLRKANESFVGVLEQMKRVENIITEYQALTAPAEGLA
jgi:hypothetical protein